MWGALAAIGLLVLLSIIGAFCGADKAKQLFNSVPLAGLWGILAVLLGTGLFAFPALLKKPALAVIHLGCLLVLVGGIWGSQAAHRFANKYAGIDKITNGYMVIYEGHWQDAVIAESGEETNRLPFGIKLNDFRIEYYDDAEKPTLHIETTNGEQSQFEAKGGIRDYFSDITVVEDGKEILNKTIEVNRPLHYGGYHFYQYSYDADRGGYTILAVVSDWGLYAVYAGYWLLCAGVIWQCWLVNLKIKGTFKKIVS